MADGFSGTATLSLDPLLYGTPSSSESSWTKSPATTTTTKSVDIQEDDIMKLINSLLADQNNGLAKLGAGSKLPGLYGSTTQKMLNDKLLADVATNIALSTAPVTQVTKLSDWEQTQGSERQSGNEGGLLGGLLGSCYITTACCKLYAKPDDCHELQTMRKFRDEFVRVKYPEAVADYYATAPGIVAAIEAREDADKIWAHFYNDYLVPAVSYAQSGEYEAAYEIYTDMVIEAEELANG